ncbi:carbohydrate ABC transporter permease [Anaeromassilibacillus senegalensis]|uniref:Carbohydrate ABC transporter permease n=1 Tax=Anaeromassilibacillus senegalensis TaxID=1673717 RepID=A0ABS9CJD8_9FIRM|nr:carbohydrate ABC transporter permease [Anaeromassilibacillus senegalensis]MCF2651048.1 carbohydrate ABC transporter permease [Anaeromassilibacillus senegalensis]MCI5650983.1 carbohydrate ABC transporter permease [Ruminococcus bromii]
MVEKNKSFQVGANIVMVILSLCCIFPFVLLIISSLTDETELIRNGYSLFPSKFSLDSYLYMFKSSNKIISAYGITILSTVVGTGCGLTMTILMAYPLSRRDLPGRNAMAFYVFFTMLFSGGLVPTYIMYTRYIKVSNTIWALIIPALMVNAFYVIMMRTYFTTNIPEAVIEAARIDGAGEFRILGTIVLPMSVPMIATMTLLIGLSYWNDWKNGLYYLQQNKSLYSIQVLLNDMLRDVQALKSGMDAAAAAEIAATMPSTGIKMAIAVVGVLPVLIVYPFFQKYFVKGITIGAVKG